MRAAGGPAPRTRGCAWTRRFGSRRSGARSSPCRRRPRGKAGFARGWAGSSVKERLLEQIGVARELGHHRNLLVSATGTGKTVRSAADYASLRRALPRDRLLFVAHREEILAQSMATFRHALRDHAFGELWVGGRRPTRFEHVFASIQSIHAAGMASLARDHFDVVIIDEFHHAAAPTYPGLLEHVAPRELLGRTATPERSDCLPLLGWFDDRIAAELRLWDAIDQHRLCTFAYFGVHDCLDLRGVPWRRGTGYDVEGLERLFTSNDAWARLMLAALARQVDDPRAIRALGFCVSVNHARFMARVFSEAGIPPRRSGPTARPTKCDGIKARPPMAPRRVKRISWPTAKRPRSGRSGRAGRGEAVE